MWYSVRAQLATAIKGAEMTLFCLLKKKKNSELKENKKNM